MDWKRRITTLLVLGLVALLGCGSKTRTPAEQFILDQKGVITPHGKIEAASVRETTDGRIQYRTTKGYTLRVSRRVLRDGTRNYGQPVEVSQ